jgi:hypothetical protein
MLFNGEVRRLHLLWFVALTVCAMAQPSYGPQGRRGGGRGRQTIRQTPEPRPAPAELHLDVAVSDSAGRPVSNLTQADFELTVDGNPQTLSSFSFVDKPTPRVVLIIDDTGLSTASVGRLRESLHAFVTTHVGGAEFAILRTLSGVGEHEVLTADPQILGAAIDDIAPDPIATVAGKSRDPFSLAGTLIVTRRALAGLAAFGGRKAVVLISEHLALAREHEAEFSRLANLAAEASAVLYTVDPGESSGGLSLAAATAGLNLNGDLSAALGRIFDDQQGYYLLGYHRADEFFSSSFGRNAPAVLKVQLKKEGMLARSRVSPLGTPPPERDFRARTPLQDLIGAINSPFGGDSIPLQLTALFGNSAARGSSLTVFVWIDAGKLSFTHLLNGRHKAAAEVMVAAYGSTGMSAQQSTAAVNLDLTAEEYSRAQQTGALCDVELLLPNPGVYQVRAAIRDETSGRMGKASQLARVLDFSTGELMLSGIVLKQKEGGDMLSSATRRIFAQGTALTYGYQILNPPATVETVLHLFRGADQIFSGSPQVLPAITLADPKRRPILGEVSLGPNLLPGRYYLEVSVNGKAHEFIDFVVR